ncbi:hypothetical protein C8R44DRAFT_893429 [Mycena epipterygia]|nr:hypothetical protein C8R44DRAFT_893429 [Mycena epipterygia]
MTETVPNPGGETASKKIGKPKREKRRREETVDEDNNPNDADESPQEPHKKKHKKNKTGFPDPQDDSALTEQASKALSYAFSQFRKPSKWKFSKPRQNWLIRNVWSSDTIPESYLSLTIQYLKYVKGGVRETLIKECQTILSTPPHKSTPIETTSEAQPVSVNPGSADRAPTETENLKRTRARALLDALETPESNSELPK